MMMFAQVPSYILSTSSTCTCGQHFEACSFVFSLPQPSILIFWTVIPEHKLKCSKGELCSLKWNRIINTFMHESKWNVVQPTTKIKLTKIFDGVNFRYENNVCDLHTKTAVLKALHLTRFTAGTHSRCQFEATSSRTVVFRILKDCCQHVCQRKRLPCKQGGGEGYRGKRPW